MSFFFAIVERDVRAFRAGGSGLQAVAFFALTGVLFVFAIGPDEGLLERIAAPVLWTGALLATLISLDQIFRADLEDGSLDVFLEATDFMVGVTLAKAFAHWLITAFPLIIAAPLLAVLLNISWAALSPLLISLLIGTPGLSLIGVFAAALAVSLPRAGMLMAMIVSPLYIPFLIFGAGAASAGAIGAPQYGTNLMLLAAAVLFALLVSPIASAGALRLGTD